MALPVFVGREAAKLGPWSQSDHATLR